MRCRSEIEVVVRHSDEYILPPEWVDRSSVTSVAVPALPLGRPARAQHKQDHIDAAYHLLSEHFAKYQQFLLKWRYCEEHWHWHFRPPEIARWLCPSCPEDMEFYNKLHPVF